jgi:two-component system sensor histidine kinase RegB
VIERWQVLRPDAQITAKLPSDRRDFTPPDGLEQAIMNVLNNAADAAPAPVEFSAAVDAGALVIDITDRGPGFTPEQKAQAGRVLFSGKPGRGWGMGLALTHATLERLGGSLTLTEREGDGTRVRIRLPWSQSQ